MRLFRIARSGHIDDLSGEGARLYGGRWNKKGTPLLYTSASRSLATVEFLVHLPLNLLPHDLHLAEIDLPDDLSLGELAARDLPAGWDSFPAMPQLAEIAGERLAQDQLVALRVPSVVIPQEWNVILNPMHPQYQRIAIVAVEPYQIDRRLLRQEAMVGKPAQLSIKEYQHLGKRRNIVEALSMPGLAEIEFDPPRADVVSLTSPPPA